MDPALESIDVYLCLKIQRGADEVIFRADPSYRDVGPWLDFASVKFEEQYFSTYERFAECHGFCEIDGDMFAVVQELRPVSATAHVSFFGKFPFAAHTRLFRSGAPVFNLVDTEAINDTAFIVPSSVTDRTPPGRMSTSDRFWSVPCYEQWTQWDPDSFIIEPLPDSN
jgi:hypothetical protein